MRHILATYLMMTTAACNFARQFDTDLAWHKRNHSLSGIQQISKSLMRL